MSEAIHRPRVHLFIGLHKTGSTSLRWMLYFYAKLLEHHGFYCPYSGWTHYVDGHFNGGHNNVAWEITGVRPVVQSHGRLTDLVREIEEHPELHHLICSEDFDYASPDQIDRLREAFGKFEVQVVLFIRNQVDWLNALYIEDQKWLYREDFDSWYQARLATDHRWNFFEFCKPWKKAFGELAIVSYETASHNVLVALLAACDAPRELRERIGRLALPRVNVTVGGLSLAFMRYVSQSALADGVSSAYFAQNLSELDWFLSERMRHRQFKSFCVSHRAAESLFPMMKKSNQMLARSYEVILGPEYLEPSLPTLEPVPNPVFGLGEIALAFTSAAYDSAVQAALKMRKCWAKRQPNAGSMIEELERSIDTLYPWPAAATALSRTLDELLQITLDLRASWICFQCSPTDATAFCLVGGCIQEVRKFDKNEWDAMWDAIHARGLINKIAYSVPREGCLILSCGREEIAFRVISAPTKTEGSHVIFMERWSAAWGH